MSEQNAVAGAEPLQTDFEIWSKAVPDGEETPSAIAADEATVAETAPASEPEKTVKTAEEEDAAAEEALPKGLKKRFRQLTGKIRDLETQLAAKPAATEEKPGSAIQPERAKAAGQPVKPKISDYKPTEYHLYEEDFSKYVEELVEFSAQQSAQKLKVEEQQATVQAKARESEQAAAAAWSTQVEAAVDEHDDYEEVALNRDLTVTPVMFAVLQASPNGAKVLYALGADRNAKGTIAATIAALPTAAAQALALGRYEAKIFPDQPSTETKQPAVTKAPKPIKPVGAGGGGKDLGKEPDPKDFNAWSKWKDRQEAAEAA